MLTPDDLAACAGATRPWCASYLTHDPRGPLGRALIAADRGTADVAYLIYVAYIQSRAPGGMLSGRPSYEAKDTLTHRVEVSAMQSETLPEFGDSLFRRLNLSIARLTADDAMWWRGAMVEHAAAWDDLRQMHRLTEAVTLAGLIDDGIRAIKEARHA